MKLPKQNRARERDFIRPKIKGTKLSRFNETTLVKFCKPEHNILTQCHTIRFGTFEFYRELNPSFAIADADEGKGITHIEFLDLDNASQAAMDEVKKSGLPMGTKIKFQGMKMSFTFSNCFIWCCSRISKPLSENQGMRFDPDYTSFYEVDDPNRFAQYLGEILWRSLSGSAFANQEQEIIESFSARETKDDIVLDVYHQDVIYVSEKRSIINEGQLYSYVKDIPRQLWPIFVKPKKYQGDCEYRFVFMFYHRHYGLLAVRKEPVDLPIIPQPSSSINH